MKSIFTSSVLIFIFVLSGYGQHSPRWIRKAIRIAVNQYGVLTDSAQQRKAFPRSIEPDNTVKWVKAKDWTSGFFPGALWYLYGLTSDEAWRAAAENVQMPLSVLQYDSTSHDLGFMLYCSYGNAYRFAPRDEYAAILMNGANALASRFDEKIGCIRSWDFGTWQYPVIIDNMMNLELLLWATEHSRNKRYEDIAVAHANTTMVNHFRPNYSCYHVVDYDTLTGKARSHETFQGYSHSSTWSRGQAWAIYGFTLMYRKTKNKQYLEHAKKVADFFLSHPTLPPDKIPYWDFDAPNIPKEPRDAAAAAITASALLEMSLYEVDNRRYFEVAETILKRLTKSRYLASKGNHHFLLKHATGSKPHNSEIDVPLNYADYYYLEGLYRYTTQKP